MITRRALLLAAAATATKGAIVGFQNPITGGQGALIRPAVKSPNYVPGVSGWTINRDGSAEFNNVTVRGTIVASVFQGTDFQIDSNGEFFYSGAPATGNLIASIARAAGTDGHANPYPKGINTQLSGSNGDPFANLVDGTLYMGQIAAGTQDLTDAGRIFSAVSPSTVGIDSGKNALQVNRGLFLVQAGTHSAGAGPSVLVNDADGVSDVNGTWRGGLLIEQLETGTIPIKIFQASGTTADIIQAINNASVNLFRVDKAGNIPVVGTITPLQPGFTASGSSATTTSSTYAAASIALSCTAVVPASGKIEASMEVRSMNSATNNTLSSFNLVGSSSGTIFSASDTEAIQWNAATSAGPFYTRHFATGLVPGETVTMTAQHRVVGGTGTFLFRSLKLQPWPA